MQGAISSFFPLLPPLGRSHPGPDAEKKYCFCMSFFFSSERGSSSSSSSSDRPEVEASGIESMRRSLATMAEILSERDAEIARVRDEMAVTRRECTKLRREMNELHARKVR